MMELALSLGAGYSAALMTGIGWKYLREKGDKERV